MHFTDAQALKALEIKETKGEAAMNDYIADYFNADRCAALTTMTDAWPKIPYLRDRESVITDSLWAHREGRFTLSVPALLPLAEGLAAEIVGCVSGNVVKAVARDLEAAGSPSTGLGAAGTRIVGRSFCECG